jgi:hypothetical protein
MQRGEKLNYILSYKYMGLYTYVVETVVKQYSMPIDEALSAFYVVMTC